MTKQMIKRNRKFAITIYPRFITNTEICNTKNNNTIAIYPNEK